MNNKNKFKSKNLIKNNQKKHNSFDFTYMRISNFLLIYFTH